MILRGFAPFKTRTKKKISLGEIAKTWVRINPLSVANCVEIRASAGIVISKHKSKPNDVILINLTRTSRNQKG